MLNLHKFLCLAALATVLVAPGLAGEVGRIKVGELAMTPMSTDHPYPGGQTLQYIVEHPGATYIKVHLAKFDLAPGDRLVVSSADGTERYTFVGQGYKNFRTDFWLNSVLGDRAILTLHSVGTGGYGFDIDYYAHGFVPLFPPPNEDDLESVCGTNQWTDVACYETTYPTEVDRAERAVVVLYNGTENCTGVKVGCPNQFLTNEHCVSSQSAVNVTEVRFDYQRSDCNGGTTAYSESYLGDLFVTDNYTLDYCLFTAEGASDKYEAAELDDRLPPVGERLYISGHPQGGPKKLSIEDDQNATGFCQADFSPINGRGTNTDVGYYCDTTGGSSGSPVWSGVTHKVIALHHFGGCPNSGGRMDLILPQISGLLSACIPEVCGDGIASGGEACDGADLDGASCGDIMCTSGSPVCLEDCTLDYGGCGGCPVCDNDGVCETDEDCVGCIGDCPITALTGTCGNNVCETGGGENCLNCPEDCNGKQNGKPSQRYCCGDGGGQNPVSCSNISCTADGNTCDPFPLGNACCGDGTCEGGETSGNCGIDCGNGTCGDGVCDPGIGESSCSCVADCGPAPATETSCTDGSDNDCDGDVDCADIDCDGTPECVCGARGDSCSSNSDCCSNRCKGNGICK